jgi:hypothetical protein
MGVSESVRSIEKGASALIAFAASFAIHNIAVDRRGIRHELGIGLPLIPTIFCGWRSSGTVRMRPRASSAD